LYIDSLLLTSSPSESAKNSNSRIASLQNWLLIAINNVLSITRMFLQDFSIDLNVHAAPHSETPLAVAALAGHADITKLLVSDFSASIHKASGTQVNGPTPLWRAIRSRNGAALRALLALRDLLKKNPRGDQWR
jgi:hypothetical protein